MLLLHHRENIFLFTILFLFAFRVDAQLNCDNDTTGLKSLIDLKTGYYLGFQGGLYPGGSNSVPLAHFAGGMNASRRILPRNEAGEVDWTNGKVGFIGLGASTAGNCFNHFEEVVADEPTVNHCLIVANCSLGAKGLDIMIDTVLNEWYWDDEIMPRVDHAGLTPPQVQAIWVMTTSKTDTVLYWPYQPRQIADKYEILMGVLLDKFPNLQMVFVTGFAYGGYADSSKEFYDLVAEPSSYWNNWAVKWLVERQINGDTDLVYSGPGKNAPWIAWGPHFWADGLRANFTDGLYWNCYTDFQPDGGGYHLTNAGKDKEADLMLDYFSNALFCRNWFLHGARWDSCDSVFRAGDEEEVFSFEVFPNPGNGIFRLQILHPPGQTLSVTVVDATGQTIFKSHTPWTQEYEVSDIDLSAQPEGLYHIFVGNDETILHKTVILLR